MSDVIVLLNDVQDGMRRVHVMANADLTPGPFPEGKGSLVAGIEIPEWATVKQYQDEIRLHHLEAIWKMRGELMEFEVRFACGIECPVCHGSGCTWRRRVALSCLENGQRVSQAIKETAVGYALRTGQDPMYTWIRCLPKGLEFGDEVPAGENIMINLFSAEWMPDRAVAVGRGN